MIHSLPSLSGDWLVHTSSAFLGQDQSTVAQQAAITVAKCSLTRCMGATISAGSLDYVFQKIPACAQ